MLRERNGGQKKEYMYIFESKVINLYLSVRLFLVKLAPLFPELALSPLRVLTSYTLPPPF